jgi:hypothetical protein
MISHEHKCIFIHIPKCGGTSIEKALGHLDEYEGRGQQDHRSMSQIEEAFSLSGSLSFKERVRKFLPIGTFKKRPSRNPKNDLVVTREQYEEYYKFTIVRDPWARAYSWYKNMMRDEKHHEKYGISGDLSFKDFLRDHAGKGMLKPQTWWLKSLDGSFNLDQIGRFETLQKDFRKACDAMGLSHIELPHILKGSSGNHREHYDEESIELISRIYKEEIELFNHSFEGN